MQEEGSLPARVARTMGWLRLGALGGERDEWGQGIMHGKTFELRAIMDGPRLFTTLVVLP